MKHLISKFILLATFLLFAQVSYPDIKPSKESDKSGQYVYHVNIKKAYAKATPEMEFQVLRDGQLVTLSLARPEDIKRVNDYDQIFLKEGFYNALSRLTQKYLKFYGQSPGKTFVTFPADAPLLADEQEFYFLTLFDIQLLSLNGFGIYGSTLHVVGSYWIIPPAHRFNTDYKFGFSNSFLDTGRYIEEWASPHYYWELNISHSNPFEYQSVIDGDRFKTHDARNYSRAQLIQTKGAALRFNSLLVSKVPQKPGAADMSAYEGKMAQARKALGDGNTIAGLMFLVDADRASGYQKHHDVYKVAKPELVKFRESSGCSIQFAPTQRNYIAARNKARELRNYLAAKLPIMDFSIPSSQCQIGVFSLFVRSTETQSSEEKGRVTEQQETQASITRRQQTEAIRRMYEAAAQRAAEKAQMARMAAAGEAMKSVTAKAQEGLARTEVVGGQKALVYGMGDWSGNVSTEVANAFRNNSDLSKELSEKAKTVKPGDADYEDVQRRIIEESAGTNSLSSVSVMISLKGKITELKSKRNEESEFKRTCTYVERNGFKQDMVCKNEANFQYNAITGNLGADTQTFLETQVFQKQREMAARKLKSADEVTQLEGHVLSWLYSGAPESQKTLELSEKYFGRRLSESDIFAWAMAF